MRRLVLSILAPLALGAGLAAPAAAVTQEDETPTDPMYLTFGAGNSFQNFDHDSGLSFNNPPNGGVRLGYEVMKAFDAELQYEFGGRFEDGDVERRVNVHTLTANVKLLPTRLLAPDFRIKPYVLAGFGWLRTDASSPSDDNAEDGWLVRGGLGFEIPIDFFISFYTEASYVYGRTDLSDVDAVGYTSLGAGLVVRFDSDGY